MTWLMVTTLDDNYVKIAADRLDYTEDKGMVYAYNADALVGVFGLGGVKRMYLSEERKG